jgi:hypothetical protein
MHYFYRQGRPITMDQWVELRREGDYYLVGNLTEDREDGTRIEISTVWLGLDHQFGVGPPLIFETMIFITTENSRAESKWMREHLPRRLMQIKDSSLPAHPYHPLTIPEWPEYPGPKDPEHPYHQLQWRWISEEQAKKGHELIVQAFREDKDPRVVIDEWLNEERKEGMQ